MKLGRKSISMIVKRDNSPPVKPVAPTKTSVSGPSPDGQSTPKPVQRQVKAAGIAAATVKAAGIAAATVKAAGIAAATGKVNISFTGKTNKSIKVVLTPVGMNEQPQTQTIPVAGEAGHKEDGSVDPIVFENLKPGRWGVSATLGNSTQNFAIGGVPIPLPIGVVVTGNQTSEISLRIPTETANNVFSNQNTSPNVQPNAQGVLVTISNPPSGAAFSINGRAAEPVETKPEGVVFRVPKGSHVFRVISSGSTRVLEKRISEASTIEYGEFASEAANGPKGSVKFEGIPTGVQISIVKNQEVKTLQGGDKIVDVPVGRWEVRVSEDGQRQTQYEKSITVEADEETIVDFTPRTGQVALRISGTQVGEQITLTNGAQQRVVTGTQGETIVESLSPGQWTVQVNGITKNVTISSSAEAHVVLGEREEDNTVRNVLIAATIGVLVLAATKKKRG